MEEEKEGSKRKVMVAIDESESSYYALIWVLENLKELISNSPLVLFSAQPTPKTCYAYAAQIGYHGICCPISPTMDLIKILQERNKVISLSLLEKAKEICASQGVKVETVTEAGEPRELICNAINNYKINLLVVGDDEVGALKRFFLGSLSNYCVNNAKCSVVVVKKPE